MNKDEFKKYTENIIKSSQNDSGTPKHITDGEYQRINNYIGQRIDELSSKLDHSSKQSDLKAFSKLVERLAVANACSEAVIITLNQLAKDDYSSKATKHAAEVMTQSYIDSTLIKNNQTWQKLFESKR